MKKFFYVLFYVVGIILGVIFLLSLFKGFFGVTDRAAHDGFMNALYFGIPFIVVCAILIDMKRREDREEKELMEKLEIEKEIKRKEEREKKLKEEEEWQKYIEKSKQKEKERRAELNEFTKEAYYNFVNSKSEINGMSVEDILKLHNESPKISHSQITNVKNGVCPTCGASLVNGTCEYCGNHFENKDDVLILIYDDLGYGSKKYTFNNGKLVHIETKAKPLAQFLV